MDTKMEYNFSFPTKIFHGVRSIDHLERLIQCLCIKTPLLCIDINVADTEFGAMVISAISKTSSNYFKYIVFEQNAPRYAVEQCASIAIERQVDGIISVGGGSTIDLAKGVIAILSSELSLDKLWEGTPISKRKMPFIAIPTTCGTGSEVTPFAVLLDPLWNKKRGLCSKELLPDAVILDSSSLISLSEDYIAATAIDALSHAVESYVSNKSTAFSKCNNLGSIITIHNNIETAVKKKDGNALENLLVASASARLLHPHVGLTIVHALSHPIGVHLNLHHGKAVAYVLPVGMKYNIETNPQPHAEICRTIQPNHSRKTDIYCAELLVEYFEKMIDSFNLNIKPQIGEKNCDLITNQIALDAMGSSNIISNPREVHFADARRIVESLVKL